MLKNSQIEVCNENCSFCFLNYGDVLIKNPLFRGLSHVEAGEIIRNIHHQIKALNKNEILAIEGDPLSQMIIILKGSVVGDMMDFEGNILRVEKIKAPDTIATAFIFGESAKLPVTITATENTHLLLIQKNDLLELFLKNKLILNNFLNIISERAQFLRKKIKLLGLNSIKGKIALYLLEMVKKTGATNLTLPHSQAELAEMFGVARPSIGRAFRELHNSNSINAKGKKVEIINKLKLSELLKSD